MFMRECEMLGAMKPGLTESLVKAKDLFGEETWIRA